MAEPPGFHLFTSFDPRQEQLKHIRQPAIGYHTRTKEILLVYTILNYNALVIIELSPNHSSIKYSSSFSIKSSQ